MTSKMCIVLRTRFVLPCPSLPQSTSQNICIFISCRKKLPHNLSPLCWRPGAYAPPLLFYNRRHTDNRENLRSSKTQKLSALVVAGGALSLYPGVGFTPDLRSCSSHWPLNPLHFPIPSAVYGNNYVMYYKNRSLSPQASYEYVITSSQSKTTVPVCFSLTLMVITLTISRCRWLAETFCKSYVLSC